MKTTGLWGRPKSLAKQAITNPIMTFHLIKEVHNIKKHLAPKENIIYFYNKTKKIRGTIESRRSDYSKLKRVIHDNSNPIKNISRIYIGWHHSKYNELLKPKEIDPKLRGFRAKNWPENREHYTSIEQNHKTALLKMAKLIENKIPIISAFDGGVGEKNLKGNLFGNEIYFARGMIYLLKEFNPEFIPVTVYIDENNLENIDIYIGKNLFRKNEAKNLSDEEILQRMINYFSEDLKKHGPHHFNFPWLLKRKYKIKNHNSF